MFPGGPSPADLIRRGPSRCGCFVAAVFVCCVVVAALLLVFFTPVCLVFVSSPQCTARPSLRASCSSLCFRFCSLVSLRFPSLVGFLCGFFSPHLLLSPLCCSSACGFLVFLGVGLRLAAGAPPARFPLTHT